MSTETASPLLTAEEFLALPEDPNVERMLIRGRILELPMTRRNKWHSSTEARLAQLLLNWRDTARRSGVVASGEAGCYLRRRPDTLVGIDVAFFPEEVAQLERDDTTLFNGPPLLAVEILSPSDTQEVIQAKIDDYLAAGLPLVWIVDPHFRTVVVHRPDAAPEMFSGEERLIGDPHLPGLEISVKGIFAGL